MAEPLYSYPHSVESEPSPREPKHGFWGKVWQVLKTVQARLRFIAILALIGLVIGNWNTINNYLEKWTRPGRAAGAGGAEYEYWCPMHPQIVRDDPNDKCPICHMDLAKRKKGSGKAEPLAPGTVSRVQLSPYRVVLAGVRTYPVQYLPLFKEIAAYGTVEWNETQQRHIAAVQKGRIVKLYVDYTGQDVKKGEKLALLDVRFSPELTATLGDLLRARQRGDKDQERMARTRLARNWDLSPEQVEEFLRDGKVNTRLTIYSPINGHVVKKYQREGSFVEEGTPLFDVDDLATVWVEAQVYEADQSLLKVGQVITATTLALPNREFHGKVDFIYPHLDESSRTLTVRFHLPNPGHLLRPGMYAIATIRIPPPEIGLVLDDKGQVLAIPDSAVIDTGRQKIVYREAAPDVFEGVEVQLGSRMAQESDRDAYYPVLKGLQGGDRVVTNGSFLIDAETRLNRAAGSTYFGSSGGSAGTSGIAVRPSTPLDEDAQEKKVKAELAKLSPADRRLVEAQKFCPILSGSRLGAMGAPFKIMLEGKPVFLCCSSCEGKARARPAATLKKVEELKKSAGQAQPIAPAVPKEDPEVKANLAKLNPADRALVGAQKLCPITGKPLGSMGVPVKILLAGQPVFLCCDGCEEDARKASARTLARVKELKAKTQGGARP